MQKKGARRGFLILLVVVVLVVLVITFMPHGGPTKVSLTKFTEEAKQGQITAISQDGDSLIGLIGGTNGTATITTTFIGSTNDLRNYLEGAGVDLGEGGIQINVQATGVDWGTIGLTVILPIVLLGLLLYFLFFLQSRRLVQLIERKQATKPEAEESKTKEIASIEAVRKLAELRDQGVLTQEEFEQKKKKLL
jgi:flagellar basal body-associated protein FliL